VNLCVSYFPTRRSSDLGAHVALSVSHYSVKTNSFELFVTLLGGDPADRRFMASPQTDPAVFFSSHYVTDTTLPALTGIEEDGARSEEHTSELQSRENLV